MQSAELNQMPGPSTPPPLQEGLRDTSLLDRFIELLPGNDTDLYIWTAGLMAVYLVVSYPIYRWKTGDWGRRGIVGTKVFDAATFAASILLLSGIVYPKVLTAIGSRAICWLRAFADFLTACMPSFPILRTRDLSARRRVARRAVETIAIVNFPLKQSPGATLSRK
jgi:hypothetical protein